jgi:hypothetical protein
MDIRMVIYMTGIFVMLIFRLEAQDHKTDIHLTPVGKGWIKPVRSRLKVNYSPFRDVQVLYNCLDSTKVYTEEAGGFPLRHIGFDLPAAITIQEYMGQLISAARKGDKSLLINIEHFHIPNIISIRRMNKRGDGTFRFPMRDYILFTASAYYKLEDGTYQKLFSIDKPYYTYNSTDLLLIVRRIMNELLELSVITLSSREGHHVKPPGWIRTVMNDSMHFKRAGDTVADSAGLALEQINRNARTLWATYPIVKEPQQISGCYRVFPDFQQNKLISGHIQMVWDGQDSVYKISPKGTDSNLLKLESWAVSDGRNVYKKVFGEGYLLLKKDSNTFWFDVPKVLPDMYTMLSVEYVQSRQNSGYSNRSGNLAFDLVGVMAKGALDEAIKNQTIKALRKHMPGDGYRHCFIDMDCGDFIY